MKNAKKETGEQTLGRAVRGSQISSRPPVVRENAANTPRPARLQVELASTSPILEAMNNIDNLIVSSNTFVQALLKTGMLYGMEQTQEGVIMRTENLTGCLNDFKSQTDQNIGSALLMIQNYLGSVSNILTDVVNGLEVMEEDCDVSSDTIAEPIEFAATRTLGGRYVTDLFMSSSRHLSHIESRLDTIVFAVFGNEDEEDAKDKQAAWAVDSVGTLKMIATINAKLSGLLDKMNAIQYRINEAI